MNDEAILSDLTKIFHEIFDDDSIVLSSSTTAKDIPDWDSFNHINIVVAVQQRFGIKFHIAEIENLHNVGDMVRLIHKKLAEKKAV